MHLDKGAIELRSWFGSLCSIVLMLILGAYTYQKFDVLVYMKDVDLITSVELNAFGMEDTFDSTSGFMVAVALSDYLDEDKAGIDPTIGELVFTHYKWGQDADGKSFTGRYQVPSHPCSKEELGLEGEPQE